MMAFAFPIRLRLLPAICAVLLAWGSTQLAPAYAQGQRASRGALSEAGQELARALEKQNEVRWQGERVVTEFGPGGMAGTTWVIRDGLDPDLKEEQDRFFTTRPPEQGEGTTGFRAQIPAESTLTLPRAPWMAGLLGGIPGSRRVSPPIRLDDALGNFDITSKGPDKIPGTALKGKCYRVAPRYQGGYVEIYVDSASGLPASVTRYGYTDQTGFGKRFSSIYTTLQANVQPRAFWFAPGVANPEATKRALPGPLMSMGQPPPHEMPDEERRIIENLIPRGFEQSPQWRESLPPGYQFVGLQPLQVRPYPIVSVLFSDGLNPVTFFVTRFPGKLLTEQNKKRLTERITRGPRAVPGASRIQYMDNWMLVAVGEHEDRVLDTALISLQRRLKQRPGAKLGQRLRDHGGPGSGGPGGDGPGGPPPKGSELPPRERLRGILRGS